MHHHIKELIEKSALHCGGIFYTHDWVHGKNGWIDCYFLSQKFPDFYNCALQTTRHAYKEIISSAAFDQSGEILPWRDNWLENINKEDHDREREAFNGLTRIEFVEKITPELANSGKFSIKEELTLHYDHHHGIGLLVTLDYEYLTVEAICDFVQKFWKNGEMPFEYPNPLTYRHDEIEYWGLDSNAVLEPWEWPDEISRPC